MKRLIKTTGWLAMAAAIIFGTAACSSSDDSIAEQQPVNPTEPKTYTMTIQATKGGDDATTRGLSLNDKTLNVTWNENEEVEVFQKTQVTPEKWTPLGKLKAKASSDGTTTLTGELTGLKDGNASTYPLWFFLHSGDVDYKNQNGVLDRDDNATKSIEDNYDYASSTAVDNYTVDGNKVVVSGGITLESQQAIVKFTLVDAITGNPLNATSLKIKGSQNMIESMSPTAGTKLTHELTITPPSATNVIYAAISSVGNSNFTLTATTEDNKTYTYEKSGVTFKEGKYYEVKVKMLPEGAVNLATLTDDYVAKDGDVLTGKLGSAHKISIADGATVTLHNVSINTDGANTSANYAGITCLGNATIKLEGTNIVKGFKDDYPGIQAGTTNKTLIIQGTDADKLTASCNGIRSTGACGIGGLDKVACGNIVIEGGNITVEAPGAGIGGGSNTSCGDITIKGGIVNATRTSLMVGIGAGAVGTCGNITIEGGTVTATGHFDGAGIGAATVGTCGDITISGGTVVATGSTKAAGIGTGFHSSHCGNITITTGVTSVTATKGSNATYCIGIDAGKTITIGGTQYYDGTNWASTELENALKVSVFQYPSAPPSGNDVNATMDGTFTEEKWQP